MNKKLEWYAEGASKQPITILGDNEKNMLITLAILQNLGSRRKEMQGKHYVDPRDLKPLKLHIK